MTHQTLGDAVNTNAEFDISLIHTFKRYKYIINWIKRLYHLFNKAKEEILINVSILKK
jgi:hypothetical protein